ncbi:uncharacterized protein LOC111251480 isoform X1 [Varroa destructor]|uniref:Uncharacterized protein n=1 Tax=Varroa destructor TaxID=109461 RepID=A0A7M7K9X6_VARDE|nr:uncharacterized protein LOC111251480 isoform X1 [Varroa destructor]
MPTFYTTVVSGSISWFLQTRIPNAWIGWLSKGLTIYIGSESLFHLKRFLQKETSSTAAASLSKTFQTLTVISGRMAETRRQDITTVTPNSATRTEATPTTILSRKTFTQDALSTVELAGYPLQSKPLESDELAFTGTCGSQLFDCSAYLCGGRGSFRWPSLTQGQLIGNNARDRAQEPRPSPGRPSCASIKLFSVKSLAVQMRASLTR